LTLARLSTLATVVLVAFISMMVSVMVFTEWRTANATAKGLASMRLANKALVAAEKVSFERGPANGLLGDGDRRDPAKAARLAKARAVSDAAMSDLDAAVGAARQTPDVRRARDAIVRAQAQLRAGRFAIDRVSALARARREPALVMGAVHAMFDIVPVVMDVAALLSRDAENVNPRLTDALVAARFAAELREYAGRLGSQFTAALTTGKPLARDEQESAWEVRGRVNELRDLISSRLLSPSTDPRILAANRLMQTTYFGDDLAFVSSVERASDMHRPYRLDTAQFAARYVPAMGNIVALRDILIAVSVEDAEARHAASLRSLIAISIVGLAALATVCGVLIVMRRRVIRPLERTAQVITDIARGELQTIVPIDGRRDEIGAVLGAVETLRRTSLEKASLETERQRLIDELRLSSTTDYLTGLMNRRAFAESSESQLASAHRHSWPLSLIIFDIDHFKNVNDRYGHDAGDVVLAALASLAKAEFRVGDIVCRYGGEEFAVLAPHCGSEDAALLTERVRSAIAAMPIPLPAGSSIWVTASFGVVVAPAGVNAGLDTLVRTADEALYRAKHDGRNRVAISVLPPTVASRR
jgi:diguanylate cyclase (GGDEF)-like protein